MTLKPTNKKPFRDGVGIMFLLAFFSAKLYGLENSHLLLNGASKVIQSQSMITLTWWKTINSHQPKVIKPINHRDSRNFLDPKRQNDEFIGGVTSSPKRFPRSHAPSQPSGSIFGRIRRETYPSSMWPPVERHCDVGPKGLAPPAMGKTSRKERNAEKRTSRNGCELQK